MHRVLFILEALTDEDVDWLLAHGTLRSLAEGEVLIAQGTPPEALYIVLSGRLRVVCEGLDEAPIAILDEGEIVGELSFLDDRPPNASVLASKSAEVFAVPRAELAAKLAEDHRFASGFYRAVGTLLARRLRDTVQLLAYYRGDLSDREDDELDFESELDPEHLQRLTQAGRRYERMLAQLRGG